MSRTIVQREGVKGRDAIENQKAGAAAPLDPNLGLFRHEAEAKTSSIAFETSPIPAMPSTSRKMPFSR